MFGQEAALLQSINESRKAIRQKHLQLKVGLADVEDEVTKVLNPIIQPLNKLTEIKNFKKRNRFIDAIKIKKTNLHWLWWCWW